MRSFERRAPVVERSDSRLLPKRSAFAAIQGDSVRFLGGPGAGGTRVSRIGFGGRCFKESAHKLMNSIEPPPKNHEASRSWKLKGVFMAEVYARTRQAAMG